MPRIYRISQSPIFPDEITWMVRAKETFLAVRTFNPEWIRNYFKSSNAWWNIKNDTEAISLPLVAATGPFIAYLGKGQSILSRNILPDYVAGRVPLVVINSLFVILLYLFAEKIAGKKIALICALFYSFDPVDIAYSRMILNDGLLTIFTMISLYSFFFINDNRWSILLSSFGLVLGFLTKPVGILPVVAWISYLILSKNKKEILFKILKIGFLSLLLIQIFWPQSWFNPFFSIIEYLSRQYHLTKGAAEIYFLGKVAAYTPFYYYLFQVLLRVPSYIFLGLLINFIIIVKFLYNKRDVKIAFINRFKELSICVFVLMYFLIIAFSVKKSGIRYLLPIWPFIYLFSFWGFKKILMRYKNNPILKAGLFFLFFIALINLYKYSPNYDYYYNELTGGPKTAQKIISVNLCYGAKESADYIKKCFPAVSSIDYIGCSKTVIPYYFSGNVYSDVGKGQLLVIEEYYRQMGFLTSDEKDYTKGKASIIIKRNGIILARIYNKNLSTSSMCRSI